MINTAEEMSAYLGTEVKVLGTHLCGAEVRGSSLNVRSADRDIIESYEPELSEGRWFADKGICAVVTEGCGYSVGDSIALEYFTADNTERQLTAAVTAVIKKDARLPGLSCDNEGAQKDTFELFYGSASNDDSSKGLLLIDESTLPDDLPRAYIGALLISYPDADESELTGRLSAAGSLYSVSMSEVDKNSRRYLAERIYELLPLIVILCIMAFVGSISTAALSTRRQLGDYAVFTLCGLQKRSCTLIGLIQSIITLAAAGALTAVSAAIIVRIYPDRFYLHTDLLLLAGETVIAALFIAVSLAVPALMIGRSEVRDILKIE